MLEQDEVAPADLTLGSAWAEGMTSIIRLRIRQADGLDAPAPIALLTDADQLRSIDFGVDTGAGHGFLSTGPPPLE